LPRDNFHERIQYDKIPYDKWHERGLLRLCDGNSIVYSDITAWFLEMYNERGIVPAWIGYDSYSARYWHDEMKWEGFRMEKVIQGARTLSLPMHQLGADLKKQKINYNNNPILKWWSIIFRLTKVMLCHRIMQERRCHNWWRLALLRKEVVRMEYLIAGIVLLVAATGYVITCKSTKK
jgi:hypothetical protein